LFGRRNQQNKAPAVAGLYEHHIKAFLMDHLKSSNLQVPGYTSSASPDLRFTSNRDFWDEILSNNHVALNWVELTHFQILDWFPRTPGLYHTPDAEGAREMAARFVVKENDIQFYDPSGKAHMIEGGVGSVRFKPIVIEGEDVWLCTATTDGVCHSGVPIAVPNRLMKNINTSKNYYYKLVGQVKYLPEFLEKHFYHMIKIPQLYVLIDHVERIGPREGGSIEITPMVFFETNNNEALRTNQNVTYVRCLADSYGDIDRGSDWLEWYCDRYHGEIITNFDQQRPIFEAAPFSLQRIMGGKSDSYLLNKYHIENAEIICDKIERIHAEASTMSVIKVDFGNGNVFHGDVVIAEKIKNSFNKAERLEGHDELKTNLQDLVSYVGKMCEAMPQNKAEEIARDLETFTTEVTSETPRRQWWELSLEGLKTAAKTVGEIGIPVIKTATALAALLTG
jgi:hypothetical protein